MYGNHCLCVFLMLLALCTWPNPCRHTSTETYSLCRHNWHHHWPALDPSELFDPNGLPDNGNDGGRELAHFSRYGGRIGWLLHASWFGAWRGLWHQYRHGYGRGGKRANHTHKANSSGWFSHFTICVRRTGVLITQLMKTLQFENDILFCTWVIPELQDNLGIHIFKKPIHIVKKKSYFNSSLTMKRRNARYIICHLIYFAVWCNPVRHMKHLKAYL